MAATAFTSVLEGALALLTARSVAQIQADIAATPAAGPLPTWTLAGMPSVAVFADRVAALEREESAAINVTIGWQVAEALEGEVGTERALRIEVELRLTIYTRDALPFFQADAVLGAANALLMADNTLGGLLAGPLTLQTPNWTTELADVEIGAIEARWMGSLVLNERTLTSALT